ncbi:hypothetical protein [Nostoc sp.]|uniref:hypothetical protein n=1 Tax=Nostoc sp. TaxID=1180 RepID=UPI002FFC37AC
MTSSPEKQQLQLVVLPMVFMGKESSRLVMGMTKLPPPVISIKFNRKSLLVAVSALN